MSHLQGIASNHIIDCGPPVLAARTAQFCTAGRAKEESKARANRAVMSVLQSK